MTNSPRRLALAAVFCLSVCSGLAYVLERFAS